MAKAKRKATNSALAEPTTAVATVELDVTTRDPEGRTPLHVAAFHGYLQTVRKMLQQHAEVDARDNQQRTPGHWCCFKGHLNVVKVLVEYGADVNARDEAGRTLLRMAVIGQQAAVEEFLRSRGAEL